MVSTSYHVCLVAHDQVLVAQKVTAGVYKGVTTTELDELAAETAASLTATHPDYALVCGGSGCVRGLGLYGTRVWHITHSWQHALQCPTCTSKL